MADKIVIDKAGMLKKENMTPAAEIKGKLKDTVAFDLDRGCGNEPPKIKLPPRVDDPPKCGNEPPGIPPIKKAKK